MENIKYAIAKQELVQEKFDEKKIMYFLSKVPEGDRADINYMQRIVNTFINSVFVYEDRVVICHNFDGDGSKITVKEIQVSYALQLLKRKKHPKRCLPIRKHRGAREKRYSFGYAVFLILALMK